MDQRLWRAYRWLDEALAHLSVIKPVAAHEFRVESLFTLSGLKLEQGFVRIAAGIWAATSFSITSRCSTGSPAEAAHGEGAASAVGAIETRLRNAGIRFRYEAQQDERKVITSGTFTVTRRSPLDALRPRLPRS